MEKIKRLITAVDVCRNELDMILIARDDLVDEFGYVKPYNRERYLILVKQAEDFRSAIEWLENNIPSYNAGVIDG